MCVHCTKCELAKTKIVTCSSLQNNRLKSQHKMPRTITMTKTATVPQLHGHVIT